MSEGNGKTGGPHRVRASDDYRDIIEVRRIAEDARLISERTSDRWALVQKSVDAHSRRMDQAISALRESDIRHTHELARFASVLPPLAQAVGTLLDELNDRKKGAQLRAQNDRIRDASIQRIELYMKSALSLMTLLGASWAVLHWAMTHYR